MKNFILLLLLLVSTSLAVNAQANLSKHFNSNGGVAIEGYDPVSYFNGKPLEGKKDITSTYQHITFQFSTQENKELFESSPKQYLPQYGGWCAYAMGDSGDKVKIDPNTYKISNGKLYLFYNFRKNNTLIPWNKDEESLRNQADKYWHKILDNQN